MALPPPVAPTVYRKLTRMQRGVGAMTQLWLGDDHLLQVMSTGYTETYRRFYLRDIQSMLIVHTARRTYYAVFFGALVAIIALIMMANSGGAVGYAILAGIFLPFFIWNHLLGSGCHVVLVTAVQQERLPSCNRQPKTRKILAKLKPLIEAAQADLAVVTAAPVAAMVGEIPPELSAPPIPPPLPPPLPLS